MNKSQKLTLIGYCSSVALILATTNLVKAGEVSAPSKTSLNSATAVSVNLAPEVTEIMHHIPKNEQEVALSTGTSDNKPDDGSRCACMGYSNFCLNCHHSPEVLG
ncbi:hypothetical protein [Merismopedia glauca]|uniref:Uncharacterized protein n=1 Tax=Merismopedia glauca CCAP 1448/3 TaxID=1296344 RepID=A0A2T1C7X7_9CYAN|nr:hypothetical protein [Merismopedia glauca]PSB04253.1 hypothetical protein C7B64_04645 [Merismopedia glauca CCAP 1448/3]